MKIRIFIWYLIFIILSITYVSAITSGKINYIEYDISDRPYHINENPTVTIKAENTGTETYDMYIKAFITTPAGKIYEYRVDAPSFKPGYLIYSDLYYDKLNIEGIGIYGVRIELWKNIPIWSDEQLDSITSTFSVIFNSPSGYSNYLSDDYWHHPSDSYIRDYALMAAAGATTTSSAAQKLSNWVHSYITYCSSPDYDGCYETCDYDNRECGDPSIDYWIIYDARGDCNDFADLYISFSRALNIPAGYIFGMQFTKPSINSGFVFPDYGPQEIFLDSDNSYWAHAWAESFVGSWKHVDPTWDNYDLPSSYKGGINYHIIARRQSNYYNYIEDGDWQNLKDWVDVTRERPYDNSWAPAYLSISSSLDTLNQIYYENNVTTSVVISHSGDMTARNSKLDISYSDNLQFISNTNLINLGNIDWTSYPITLQLKFNAKSIGNGLINLRLLSDDTLVKTSSISFNINDRDDDEDGILNNVDKCPLQKGPLCNNGCPDTLVPIIKMTSPFPAIYPYQKILISLSVIDNNSSNNSNCLDKVWMNNGIKNIILNSSYYKYYNFDFGTNNLIFYANDTSGNLAQNNLSFIVDPKSRLLSCDNYTSLYNCNPSKSITSIDSFTLNSSNMYRDETINAEINWTGWHDGDINFWAFFLGNSSIPIKTCVSFADDYNINNSYSMRCLVNIPINTIIGNNTLTVTSNDNTGYCRPYENGVDAESTINVYIDCFNNWVLNTTWSKCDNTNYQYENYYDINNCNKNIIPPPINQSCDYCKPNWIEVLGKCKSDESQVGWFNDTNLCYLKTNLESDLEGRLENITHSYSCDYDKDGFIGAVNNVNTTINLKVEKVNNTTQFKEDNNTIIEFESNDDPINLANIFIEKQSNESSFAYISIKGLELPQNKTKIVYLDRILKSKGICIKDKEIVSINEISTTCTGTDELWLACPDSNGDYSCELVNNDTKYKISGLKHSGIKEQDTYCGDSVCNGAESCSSCSSDCGVCQSAGGGGGGGGGGGSGGGSPSSVVSSITPTPVPSTNVPTTTTSESKEQPKQEQTKETAKVEPQPQIEEKGFFGRLYDIIKGLLTSPTGAVVGATNQNKSIIIVILAIVVLIVLFLLYLFLKRKIKRDIL